MTTAVADPNAQVLDAITGLKTDFSQYAAKQGEVSTKVAEFEERFKVLEASVRQHLATQISGNGHMPKSKWSFARYAMAMKTGDWNLAKFEKQEIDKWREEVQKDVILQTMYASDFAGGGAWIPPQYTNEIIGFLRPELVSTMVGARVITGISGSPFKMPKLTSGSTYYWIAPEGTAVPESQPATGMLDLIGRKIGVLVKMSNDLRMINNPDVETSVRTDMVLAIAEGVDKAFFQGTGLLGQPRGLTSWDPAIPIQTAVTWATDDITKLNSLKTTVKALADVNALRGKLAWASNIESWYGIDKLKDGQNRPYLQPDPANATGQRLLGYPFFKGTQVSPVGTNTLFFANWDDAMIAIWANLSMAISTETSNAFAQDEFWLRALMTVDIGFRRNISFVRLASVA